MKHHDKTAVCAGAFFVLVHLLNGLSYVPPSSVVENLLLSIIWICGCLFTRSLWFSISMHAALDRCSFLIGILLFSGLVSAESATASSLLWLETPFVALIFLALVGWTLWGEAACQLERPLHRAGCGSSSGVQG